MQLSTQNHLIPLRVVFVLGGVQLLLLSPTYALCQEPAAQPHKIVDRETYSRVLDLVFPRALPTSLKVDFAFALRFEPSNHLESQIVIVAMHGGGAEVTRYGPEGGGVWARLNASLARGATENADEMARSVMAQRTVVAVPDRQVRQWHSRFFADAAGSLGALRKASERYERPDGTQEAVVDGTYYELWYSQGDAELSWHRLDVEVDNPDSLGLCAIVRWMNTVRLDVERAAGEGHMPARP